VQIDNGQPGSGLKIAAVAVQERGAVREGGGGDDGVGQLQEVLLAQADEVLLPHQFYAANLAHIGKVGAVERQQIINPQVDVFEHFPNHAIGQGERAAGAGRIKHRFQGGVAVAGIVQKLNGGAFEQLLEFNRSAPVANQPRRN